MIARLREIERKCASMGTRNEEFPQMQERLAGIIRQLEAGDADESVSYRAIARELFPVAHLFESLGFMSVGKEIAHIERALTDLEPESSGSAPDTPPASTRRAPTTSAATREPQPPEEVPPEAEDETSDKGVPRPIIVGLLVLAAACLVAASIILKLGPFAEMQTPRVAPTAVPPPATQTPAPEASPTRVPAARGPNTGARLAEEISQARLALARGDIDGALPHLSAAALIDHDNTNVAEIAKRIVAGQISHSNRAADEARWADAEEILERARRLAMRFNLETGAIDEAAVRHKSMVRFVMVDPGDRQGMRAARGKRVVVTQKNGITLHGRIEDVADMALLLEVDKDVGGGKVRFIDDIPLSTIRSIQVFED